LPESRQRVQSGPAPPQEPHVWSKDLVPRTHQVIAAPFLNIDETVRSVLHAVKKDLRARSMSSLRHASYINDRSKGIRCDCACDQTRLRGKKWLQGAGGVTPR